MQEDEYPGAVPVDIVVHLQPTVLEPANFERGGAETAYRWPDVRRSDVMSRHPPGSAALWALTVGPRLAICQDLLLVVGPACSTSSR